MNITTNEMDNHSFNLKNLKEQFANVEIGDMSDGYHTFNELYHHRAVQNARYAWKSKLHADGTMYDNMFIVGMNLPIKGALYPVTYHYDIEPYWDMFNVKELERAPNWDGHTPWDAVDRLERFSQEVTKDPYLQIF